MKELAGELWSHHSENKGKRYPNSMVRMSQPKRVASYPKLVQTVARIQYGNPEYSLFFRGQGEDYTLDDGSSSMYPSIFRGPDDLGPEELKPRMAKLVRAEALLLEQFAKINFEGHAKLTKFRELCWAILQHYDVCATPLLDVTSSLQAAASFALGHESATGILYVLGFPHINGSISYYVEEELLNIKLLSICPPEAQRPYFQEGFLVGTFPTKVSQKQPSLDVACRLIAKFRIGWPSFWGEYYASIPEKALFPQQDRVKEICDNIKATINTPVEEDEQGGAVAEKSTGTGDKETAT
jgi:hypothetical protein